jgi:hypothetical protein
LKKSELYGFTHQVYQRLGNHYFILRFIRDDNVHGYCYPGANTIEMNPKGQLLATLVHEMLHDLYPSWDENKVLARERLIMAQLSHRQMANLMVAMGNALLRSHKG